MSVTTEKSPEDVTIFLSDGMTCTQSPSSYRILWWPFGVCFLAAWWLNHPFETYWSIWIISPSRDENKTYLKPPPRFYLTSKLVTKIKRTFCNRKICNRKLFVSYNFLPIFSQHEEICVWLPTFANLPDVARLGKITFAAVFCLQTCSSCATPHNWHHRIENGTWSTIIILSNIITYHIWAILYMIKIYLEPKGSLLWMKGVFGNMKIPPAKKDSQVNLYNNFPQLIS